MVDATDVGADLEEVLIPAEQLQARIAELAAQIDADYAGRELLLVGVLKGAVMVMADLARAMQLPVEMDWMAVSSYGSGTRSSGVVRILKDLDADITGRHVLVVEDIVDSGLTLSWLVGNLQSRGPRRCRSARCCASPAAARMDVDVAYIGFDIANEFVVGYGLDYAERYRNLPFIGTLAPHVYGGTGRQPAGELSGQPGGEHDQRSRALMPGKGRRASRRRFLRAKGYRARCTVEYPGAQPGIDEGSRAWSLGRTAVPPGVGGTMRLVRRDPPRAGGVVHRWI